MGACSLILHIHIVANWQLSKQGIRWPVSHVRIAGSGVDSFCLRVFLSYPLTSYWFSNDRRFKFKFCKCTGKKLYFVLMSRSINIFIDSGSENLASFYRLEDSCFWLFFQRSLIGQAFRHIFMLWLLKIRQVGSRGKLMHDLETCLVIAELIVFCHLILAHNERQLLSRFFCYSWLVCLLGFWLRNAPLFQVIGNPFSDGIVFKNENLYLTLLDA